MSPPSIKKHQIVVDAQAFGEGQEHHTLKPVIERIKQRFADTQISEDIIRTGVIITADTGFANEANMKYLHENEINAYIPDNQFRSRDPKFKQQKAKYGKRHQDKRTTKKNTLAASEFHFDPVSRTCVCPAGNNLSPRGEREDKAGNQKIFFEGRLSQCRACARKQDCMRNPASANHRKGNGRQVSFILDTNKKPRYTDWMKRRVDSDRGKQIYSHRMSVVEPVFGNLESNKRLTRFSLRGLKKVNAQWKLFCMIQNIEKLANYGKLAA